MGNSDLFAISQGGQAKKVTWETFYTYLAEALDGHGGINDIAYTAPASGSINGTVTITLADGTTESFTIKNGKGIASITQYWAVSSSDSTEPSSWQTTRQTMTTTNRYLWSYYRFTFNDNTTTDTPKAVIGVYGDTGQAWYVHIKWSETEPDQNSDMKDTPDNWVGIYSGTSQTAPTAYTSYQWFEYKGEKGDTGTSIDSVEFYSTSGLTDVYHVNFSDGTYTSFSVTNGAQIDYIAKTATAGLTDTYTVYLTDGTNTTFNVINGRGITSITEVDVTHTAGHTDIYRFNFNDGDSYTYSVYNGTNGCGSVSTVDDVPSANQNVPLLTFGYGPPTTSTAGLVKQRYFDQTNSILYICVGVDTTGAETTYTWQGAGVTVDNALSSMSTNPVQNAILTSILGTATLTTTSQQLTGAVNELNAGKVNKAGDTMTGDLIIKHPGTAEDAKVIYFYDGSDSTLGFVRHSITGAGASVLDVTARKYVSGTSVFNGVSLSVNSDGTKAVAFNDAAAWRSGLGLGTSGAFPLTIAQGGTGQTVVNNTTTIANIATAGTNVSITSAYYYYWGKVASLRLDFKANAALNSAATLATLVSDKRPAINAYAMDSANGRTVINPGGTIQAQHALTNGQTLTVIATYLLPN